jgi:hypothetical protein
MGVFIMIKLIAKLLLLPFIAAGLLLSSCSYSSLGQIDKDKVVSYSKQILEQAGKNIELKVELITKQLLEIALSKPVQDRINCTDDFERLTNAQEISDLLVNKFAASKYIENVTVELNGGFINSYRPSNSIGCEEVREYLNLENNHPLKWTAVKIKDKNYMVLSKKILSLSNAEEIGQVHIVLKDSYFNDIIKGISYGGKSRVFILDTDNIVITSTSPDIEAAKKYRVTELIGKIKDSKTYSGILEMSIDNVDNYIFYSKIEKLNWYLVGVIPAEDL